MSVYDVEDTYFVAKEFIIQFFGIRPIGKPTAYTDDSDRKLGRHSFAKKFLVHFSRYSGI